MRVLGLQCPNCGKENAPDAIFCPRCGVVLTRRRRGWFRRAVRFLFGAVLVLVGISIALALLGGLFRQPAGRNLSVGTRKAHVPSHARYRLGQLVRAGDWQVALLGYHTVTGSADHSATKGYVWLQTHWRVRNPMGTAQELDPQSWRVSSFGVDAFELSDGDHHLVPRELPVLDYMVPGQRTIGYLTFEIFKGDKHPKLTFYSGGYPRLTLTLNR